MPDAKITITVDGAQIAQDAFKNISDAMVTAHGVTVTLTSAQQDHTKALNDGSDAIRTQTDLLPNFISRYLEARTIFDLARTAYSDYVSLLKTSVESFGEAEQAEVRLTAALNNTGAEGATVAYRALADQLAATSVISRTMAIDAEGTFTLIGKVGPDQMGLALQAAADLAAGTGRSFDSIVLAIAKATEGNVTALKRFGVEVDANAVKGGDLSAVFDAIEAKFKGQAEVLSGTLLGSWQQMGNQWDIAKEQLGADFAPVLVEAVHGLEGLVSVVQQSPAAFLLLVGASTALAASMAWMGVTAVYGAQLAAISTLVGGALSQNLVMYEGVLTGATEETVVFASATTLAGAALGVLAVAAGAWMIGEWIGNVTGATAAIQHWAGAAGDAAMAAQTAGAQQDTINYALSRGAPIGISYGDAVAYIKQAFKSYSDTAPDATNALAAWQKMVNDTFAQIQQQKLLLDALRNDPGFVSGGTFDFAKDEADAKKAETARQKYLDDYVKNWDTAENQIEQIWDEAFGAQQENGLKGLELQLAQLNTREQREIDAKQASIQDEDLFQQAVLAIRAKYDGLRTDAITKANDAYVDSWNSTQDAIDKVWDAALATEQENAQTGLALQISKINRQQAAEEDAARKKIADETQLQEMLDAIQAKYDAQRQVATTANAQKVTADTAAIWTEYYDLEGKASMSTTDLQIAQVQKWYDDKVEKAIEAGIVDQKYYDALYALSQEKMQQVYDTNSKYAQDTKKLLSDLTDGPGGWVDTFSSILVHTGSFTQAVKGAWGELKTDTLNIFSDLLSKIIHDFLDALLAQVAKYVEEMVIKLAIIATLEGIFGFASGGVVDPGGSGAGDFADAPGGGSYAAAGGVIYAARGWPFVPMGTDTVPAMLTPGEGILTRDTTERLGGASAISALNNGSSLRSGGGTASDEAVRGLHNEVKGMRADFAKMPIMLKHAMRGA